MGLAPGISGNVSSRVPGQDRVLIKATGAYTRDPKETTCPTRKADTRVPLRLPRPPMITTMNTKGTTSNPIWGSTITSGPWRAPASPDSTPAPTKVPVNSR
jgi:hypothetical protein